MFSRARGLIGNTSAAWSWLAESYTSLTLRITLAFVLLSLAVLVGVAALAFYSGRAGLQRATVSGLTKLAIEKEAELDDWFSDMASQIQLLADTPFFVTGLQTLRAVRAGSPEYDAARNRMNDTIARVFLRNGEVFSSLFALDPETGKLLVASDVRDIDKYREDRAYFVHGKSGTYIQGPYYSLPEGGPSIVFSAPVSAADGSLLAVVAGRANMSEIQAIVGRHSQESATDDNFIVNKAGLFVTQPRYLSDQAALRFGVLSDYVERCLDGNSGVAIANDYRPEPVIAVFRWLGARQFCLVTKVDQAEALAPIQVFRNRILLIAIATLLLASATAILLARSITRPIRALRTGAERIGRGERDIRLPERSRDELGVLAREFNNMAKSLAESEAELRRNEAQLRLFIEAAPAGIAMFDRDMRYLVVSRRFAEDRHVAGEQLIGRSHYEIFPEVPQNWRDVHRRCLDGATERCDEDQFVRSNGETEWVRWEMRPWYERSGVIGGAILFSEFITERKRAQQLIEQQQEAIRKLSTPVLQLHEGVLVAPIIGRVDTERAAQLLDHLLQAVRSRQAKVVVIDVTGLAAVDANVAAHLAQTAQAVRLMGARAIVTGISATVAQTLVDFGIDLGELETAVDLQAGLERAQSR